MLLTLETTTGIGPFPCTTSMACRINRQTVTRMREPPLRPEERSDQWVRYHSIRASSIGNHLSINISKSNTFNQSTSQDPFKAKNSHTFLSIFRYLMQWRVDGAYLDSYMNIPVCRVPSVPFHCFCSVPAVLPQEEGSKSRHVLARSRSDLLGTTWGQWWPGLQEIVAIWCRGLHIWGGQKWRLPKQPGNTRNNKTHTM